MEAFGDLACAALVLIAVVAGFLMGRQTQDRGVKMLKKQKPKKIKAEEFDLR